MKNSSTLVKKKNQEDAVKDAGIHLSGETQKWTSLFRTSKIN